VVRAAMRLALRASALMASAPGGSRLPFRVYLGYGAHSRIHTAKILRLSEDLPVVIEIVDAPDKIEDFLPVLDEMMAEGMVTVEQVKVITYRHHAGDGAK
jgi:PII-like signaling protein